MTRMPLADRRQQLVDAAIAVMKRDGVNKATTRAIVAEAGTSLSVFHYCFDSKDALLDAVIKTIVGKTATLAEASMVPGTDRVEMLKAAMRAYWEHLVANPEEHLLTYEVTQYCLRNPELAHVAKLQYEHYANAYVTLFATAGLRSTWPMETLARYLAVIFDGLTLDWLARRDDDAAYAVLDAVADHVGGLLRPL
ncbi:MAG TPA: TetR/AcrR family transcriptional regulator [Nocardioidaceae bacterium]|nr:TetR/AcrR family transcriptional regulator [Nocardioidaceae bacterium]